MKVWKSEKKYNKHDIWGTEIRLRDVDTLRQKKVNKLLKLLVKEKIKEQK